MSEDEIKKAVDEAEKYAAEDKKRKEEIETINQADSLIYQTEKTMNDMADKMDPADKAKLETELADFKKVREGNDAEQIKAAMETFSKSTYEIFGKMYQQAQPGAEAGAQGGVNPDGTVDTEFTDNN
jgi:molecular chaperone DnaK